MSKDIIKYFEKKSVFDGIISSEIEAVIEDLLKCESSNDYPSGIYYKKRKNIYLTVIKGFLQIWKQFHFQIMDYLIIKS